MLCLLFGSNLFSPEGLLAEGLLVEGFEGLLLQILVLNCC